MIVPKQQGDPRLAQLERIVASDAFTTSERLSRFLRFVVEETIAGRGDQIKEYLIGVEVFDKGQDYDPRVDSTVRSEAGKLRSRLARYYEEMGKSDPVVITVPKGSYVPVFETRTVVEMPASPRVPELTVVARPAARSWKRPIAAAVTVATLGTIAYLGWPTGSDVPLPRTLIPVTHDTGLSTTPALSREGKLLVYASNRAGGNLDLWLQPVSGGQPLRLTRDPADESDPDFSPDGSTIVFRSERDGGGVYMMPALGGEARLLARGGRRPRFSPDGRLVVYYEGNPSLFMNTIPSGRIFVAPVAGGSPRALAQGFPAAVYPLFTPDGAGVLFWGYEGTDFATSMMDWYVAPLDGSKPVKTGVRAALVSQGICDTWASWPPNGWHGSGVVFSAGCKGVRNLWRVPLSSDDWKPAGPAVRLTFGTGSEAFAAVSATGEIAFASIASNQDIWMQEFELGSRPIREPVRLTTSSAGDHYPSISADGRKVVYASSAAGDVDIWIKDLTSGDTRPLLAAKGAQNYPEIAPDGESFIYHEVTPDPSDPVAYNHVAWRQLLTGGSPVHVCDRCSYMGPGTSLGTYFDHDLDPSHIAAVETASGKRTPYLRHQGYEIMLPAPSPDRRWIAFTARVTADAVRVLITRFSQPPAPPESEWKPVADGLMPVWSPDSRWLYFASPRDGNLCLWASRIDPQSGVPSADLVALSHFHGASRRITPGVPVFRWMSATRDKIVFPAVETSGNIWVLR